MTETTRRPVPLRKLIEHCTDDGSDYNDGLGGWTGAAFDEATGVLTLTYERDNGFADYAEDEDYQYASTVARFQLIPYPPFTDGGQ